MIRVAAYVPDLMDRSKIAAAAPDVSFVSSLPDLVMAAEGAELVVVDLSRPGAIEALVAMGELAVHPYTIGFGSHVDRELLAAATTAGCDLVLPRSKFFSDLAALLASTG